MKRITAFAAATVSVASFALFAAPSAHAAGAIACQRTDGGTTVCINDVSDGYRASATVYLDTEDHWLDFNLTCANGYWYGDGGAFKAGSRGNNYSYVFKVGRQGRCWVQLKDLTTGKTYDSPVITR
jgi:hypothetical protein